MQEWYSLLEGGVGEIEEKKSRFIATFQPVTTPTEAAEFIAAMKKRYWDARHNCSAYVIGDEGQLTRCSDDGEPSGTAGRPMLDVLLKEGVTNVCVVVTRYFGGTLLGTGGLIRAYQGAVKEGLAASKVLKKIKGREIAVRCDYTDYGKLQFLCGKKGYYIADIEYGSDITMKVYVSEEECADAVYAFREAANGKASIDDKKTITFAIIGDEAELF